jgi:hypothetical protein
MNTTALFSVTERESTTHYDPLKHSETQLTDIQQSVTL